MIAVCLVSGSFYGTECQLDVESDALISLDDNVQSFVALLPSDASWDGSVGLN